VADALVARSLLDEQAKAQEAVQNAQAERLKLADARYKNGIDSSLTLLDAERDFFSAELDTVQVRLLRLTNAIDLYRALGGGLIETSAPVASSR
jgi:multidrug efflux system outer membrane protein